MRSIQADQSILNEVLNRFTIFSLSGSNNLRVFALSLFASLIVIDLILAVAMNLGSPDTIKTLFKRILKYGLLKYVIDNWGTLMGWVLNGFTFSGTKAAGITGNYDNILTELTSRSTGLTKPLIYSLNSFDIFNLPSISDFLIPPIGIIIFLTFLWIGISYVVTMIEFNVVATLSLILIPFGGLKQTAFITQKVTNGVINFGIKVMVLSFLMRIAVNIMMNMADPTIELTKVLYLWAFSILLAFLSWHAPALIAGFMNGASTMSANTVLGDTAQMVQVAATVGAAVATGGSSAALGAVGAASGAGGATAAGAGAATSGAAGAAGGASLSTGGAGAATSGTSGAAGGVSGTSGGTGTATGGAGGTGATTGNSGVTAGGTGSTGAAAGGSSEIVGGPEGIGQRLRRTAAAFDVVGNVAGIISNMANNSDKK